MIYALLLLTIYIWPFGQLLTFTHPSFPLTIYLLDVVVLLLSISLIVTKKRKEIFSSPISKSLAIFLGVAVLSLLVSLKQGISSGLPLSVFYLLRLIIYPSLFFAGRYVGFSRLKKPLIVSLGIFTLLCLLQYFIFPDMRYLKNLGFDDHYFRLIGSFYDPNFTGAVLAGIALFFIGKDRIYYSLLLIGLLATTTSRASYLVFVFCLIYYLFSNKKIKIFLLLLFLGVIIYLIPKPFGEGVNLLRTFSIISRIDSWQQGINLFLEKPFFGWGYNTLRGIDGSRFQIDNSFIYLLATTGIVGLFSFLNLLRVLFKNLKDTGVRLLIISLLIHSFFNNTLFFIWILSLTWLALGLGLEKTKEYKQS